MLQLEKVCKIESFMHATNNFQLDLRENYKNFQIQENI